MKEIKLTNSELVAIVDDEDFEKCSSYSWHLEPHGYVNHTLWESGRPKHLRLHRFVTNAKRGEVVDHSERNKLDCRKSKLRITRQVNNTRNRVRPSHRPMTSRFKGVRLHGQTKKWTAQICVDYKRIYLGSFTDEQEAALAYDRAARMYYGEYARPNFQ